MPKAIRYKPLYDYLKQQGGQFVEMGFSQIEEILGFKLPASARKHRAFWSNNVHNAAITYWWLKAGYIATDIDWSGERLIFAFAPDEAMSALKKKEAGSSFRSDAIPLTAKELQRADDILQGKKRRMADNLDTKEDIFDFLRGILRYEGDTCTHPYVNYISSYMHITNAAPKNVLLDTCTLIHLSTGKVARDVVDYIKVNGVGVYVLSILSVEMEEMAKSENLIPSMPLHYIFEKMEKDSLIRVVDPSYEVFLDSANLPDNPPEDMIERVLIAAARRYALAIMTRNKDIISYASQGHVKVASY